MLPEEQASNSRYFYELASGKFGFSFDKVRKCQAFHFKAGQGAKTGTGGHLPAKKVSEKIAFNNGELGKISKEQRAGEWEVWQTSLVNPSFAAYAELCGAFGVRASRLDELDGAIEKALGHDGPALVEIMTDALLV